MQELMKAILWAIREPGVPPRTNSEMLYLFQTKFVKYDLLDSVFHLKILKIPPQRQNRDMKWRLR